MSIDESSFGEKNENYIEKMLSKIPFKNNTVIPCDPVKDCNSKGNCKKNITNFYNKCDCMVGFYGEKCTWTSS